MAAPPKVGTEWGHELAALQPISRPGSTTSTVLQMGKPNVFQSKPTPRASRAGRRFVGGSMWDTAAIPAGSRKAVLKKFENVSELGSKRQ
jgi:hypothetical protein